MLNIIFVLGVITSILLSKNRRLLSCSYYAYSPNMVICLIENFMLHQITEPVITFLTHLKMVFFLFQVRVLICSSQLGDSISGMKSFYANICLKQRKQFLGRYSILPSNTVKHFLCKEMSFYCFGSIGKCIWMRLGQWIGDMHFCLLWNKY